jgi:CheY-like chemotaxis protein/Tfp pilus assembly protein PilZ
VFGSRGGREQRLVSRLPVEFVRPSGVVRAESEDLSSRGIFVRTDAMLPVGEPTSVVVLLPNGNRMRFVARVAHILMPAAARALGRHVGIGFEFVGKTGDFEPLAKFLQTIRGEATNPGNSSASLALIAEPSEPLRARLARCMERAGFEVRTYESAADALAASTGWRPDVVIAALEMAGMSGIDLAYAMADHAQMSTVPLVLTSEGASDMTRLEAFRAGVRDVIPRPFLDEELVIRVHRVSNTLSSAIGLRGTLGDVALGTLLSLFEFERKSGVLLLVNGPDAARLFVCEGRIFKIEGGGAGVSRERIMRVLDWATGQFEFSAGPMIIADEVGASTTNILLQHAQRSDEASA